MKSIRFVTELRYVAIGIALGLAASDASGQGRSRWLILSNGEPSIRLDTASVLALPNSSTESGVMRVWLRVDYTNAQRVTEEKKAKFFTRSIQQADIDCSLHRMRHMRSILYSAKGEVVWTYESTTSSEPPWHEPVPESVGEAIIRTVCKWVSARPSYSR